MNNSYRLDLDVWKENFSNIVERDARQWITYMGACRIGKNVKFKGYGIVNYDEDDQIQKYHPIITEQDEYNKKTSNVLIFDVDIPNCDYDKLFIYQNKQGNKGAMGFYVYSTKDPSNHIHKYYITNEVTQLLQSVNDIIFWLLTKDSRKMVI